MKRTLLAIAIGTISAGLVSGVLAQDNEAELNEEAAVGEEQAAETQQAQGVTTDDDAQDAAADEESEPAEASTGGEASLDEGADAEDHQEVRDDDGDNGDQAEAAGEGDESAMEPKGADDAEMQTDPGEQATSTEPDAEQAPEEDRASEDDQAAEGGSEAGFEEMEPAGASLDSSIASLQVSEIEGMTIVNAEGETLGQVENVLRHDDAEDLHAVVSVGGFWIFGGSDVALPLADMQLEGEQLVLQDIIGKDELDDLATGYDEERYSEVDNETSLSEAMGN